MAYWFRIYRANLRQAWSTMAQYRMGVLIWAVWGFVGPLISLAVWSATTASRGKPVSAGGVSFGHGDFAAYFLVFMIYSHISMSWDVFEFAWRVRDGRLSPYLLRPLHPIHTDAATNIGFKLFTSAVLLPVWVLLFVLLRPHCPATVGSVLLSIPALLLGAVIRYVLQYCLAVIAFWTTRVDAINQLYFTLDSFLSGRIAPLSLLPGWLGAAATLSPFRAMGAFPVEIALGRLPANELLPGFALQLGWLCAAILLLRVMWKAGVRQYAAAGA